MVPELTICNRCGRTVIVIDWAPIFEDAVELAEADDSHSLEISCKVDCPTCGTHIQTVAPAACEKV